MGPRLRDSGPCRDRSHVRRVRTRANVDSTLMFRAQYDTVCRNTGAFHRAPSLSPVQCKAVQVSRRFGSSGGKAQPQGPQKQDSRSVVADPAFPDL
jgi:hypothetical protein